MTGTIAIAFGARTGMNAGYDVIPLNATNQSYVVSSLPPGTPDPILITSGWISVTQGGQADGIFQISIDPRGEYTALANYPSSENAPHTNLNPLMFMDLTTGKRTYNGPIAPVIFDQSAGDKILVTLSGVGASQGTTAGIYWGIRYEAARSETMPPVLGSVPVQSRSATPPSGNIGAGFGYTNVDRSWKIANGSVVTAIEAYSLVAATITPKIVKFNSAGNYDVVASLAPQSHSGGGWQSFSASYTVPSTGDYHAAFYTSGQVQANSNTPRAYASGDVTGNGVSFTEDVNNAAAVGVVV